MNTTAMAMLTCLVLMLSVVSARPQAQDEAAGPDTETTETKEEVVVEEEKLSPLEQARRRQKESQLALADYYRKVARYFELDPQDRPEYVRVEMAKWRESQKEKMEACRRELQERTGRKLMKAKKVEENLLNNAKKEQEKVLSKAKKTVCKEVEVEEHKNTETDKKPETDQNRREEKNTDTHGKEEGAEKEDKKVTKTEETTKVKEEKHGDEHGEQPEPAKEDKKDPEQEVKEAGEAERRELQQQNQAAHDQPESDHEEEEQREKNFPGGKQNTATEEEHRTETAVEAPEPALAHPQEDQPARRQPEKPVTVLKKKTTASETAKPTHQDQPAKEPPKTAVSKKTVSSKGRN